MSIECEHGQLARSCNICPLLDEIKELECLLKLTEYNLVYILKHNKKLLLPPTLTFEDKTI